MGCEPRTEFNGFEIPLRKFSGAIAARVIHPGQQQIEEHTHEWACITLPVIGQGEEEYDGGDVRLEGPSAVLHPTGAAHADRIAETGLETVSVQFDPAWLKGTGLSLRLDQSRSWRGGTVGAAACRLKDAWANDDLDERDLATETARFIHTALSAEKTVSPPWLGEAVAAVASTSERTAELARRLDLNPAWLARAYRTAMGEGVRDTMRRKRVEKAVSLIRGSAAPLADIAVASGFCDQSHMNRTFSALVGRTPAQIKAEHCFLSTVAATSAGAA